MHATFVAIAAEACLVSVFIAGIQGVLLNMLPLTFLPGRSVYRWNRKAWLAVVVAAAFAFVHLLLGRGSGYVGSTSGLWPALTFITVVALMTAAVLIYFMHYDAKHPRSDEDEPEVAYINI